MATTLLDIKADASPLEEDEETKVIDPRAELWRDCLSIRRLMANELAGKYFDAEKILYKSPLFLMKWNSMKRRTKNEPRLAVPSCHGSIAIR